MGETGAGHALKLPLWDPPSVLRRLGEGIHVALPARASLTVGSRAAEDVDVRIEHATIAARHATLERLDESLLVRDGGAGDSFEYDRRADRFNPRDTFIVNVGDPFALGTVRLMALEARLASLVPTLQVYCGADSHLRVDEALIAIIDARPLCLEVTSTEAARELASTIHGASPRREHPLTFLEQIPDGPDVIDSVCTAAACGMCVVDLRGGAVLSDEFLDALRSRRFHLWPCFFFEPDSRHARTVLELNPHWL